MASRDAFVHEVAQTIEQRHGHGTESFVFGLSGRWGEGKTFFLEQLRSDLGRRGFEVIDLNPWKYAADRVAFLRSFLLRLLDSQSGSQRLASACNMLRSRGRLSKRVGRAWAAMDPFGAVTRRRLRVDVSRQSISWVRLALLAPVFYWLFTLVSSSAGNEAQSWQKWLAAIPAGIAIWLVQGLVASQVSTKAATALDDFDAITSAALGVIDDVSDGRPAVRKVVVLVDDLDRVTARVARDVLDNLRTFFDKPALSFVVTGDHEVLEANLGAELAPRDAALAEQRELGRLFLKKIFNVYWRLPLPVPSDFERFIDAQLDNVAHDLAQLIPDDADRQRLRDWLLLYTGNNLRQVERMLDTVLFSLRLIRAQQQTAVDPQQLRVLTQMVEEPMLLARVLFIQDRCAPFFDVLTANAELLYELDVAVHEARTKGGALAREAVTDFLNALDNSTTGGKALALTAAQRTFLTEFIYEPPSFHDPQRGGKYVAGIAPWVHLACDAGLRDSAGPRPEDMIRAIENQNREALSAQLATCSETRSEDVAPKVVDNLVSDAEVDQRIERLHLVLEELVAASPEAPLVVRMTDCVRERLSDLLAEVSGAQRVACLLLLAAVLRVQGFESIPEDLEQHYSFTVFGDLQHVPRAELDALQSFAVVGWLRGAYEQNQADALPILEELVPHLTLEGAALTAMGSLMTRIREDLLEDANDDRKTRRLRLLTSYGQAELGPLADEVLLRMHEESVWQWAASVAGEEAAPWSRRDLEDALLDMVAGTAEDSRRLLSLLEYSIGKLDDRADELWQRVDDAREAGLLGLTGTMGERPNLASLELPKNLATRLYEQLAGEVWGLAQDNEASAAQRARLLDPQVWLWSNADRRSMWKSLGPLADKRRRFSQLQGVVRPFRDNLLKD